MVQAIPSLHLAQKFVLWHFYLTVLIVTAFINLLLLSFIGVVFDHEGAIFLDYLVLIVPQLS